MASPIILYDIPSKLDINTWSPNTWKTRYALNIKGLPHKTEWVELPDIEALAKKIGARATGTRDDGTPKYTIPIIQDPNTGQVVSDSFLIAEYLDATYPDGRTLFPHGTTPLVAAFEAGVKSAIRVLFPALHDLTSDVVNPPSEAYLRRIRKPDFSKRMEACLPAGLQCDTNLAEAKEGLAVVDGWLAKSGGKFVLGDTISYAGAILAGWLVWINEFWEDVATWHNE